MVKVLFVCHGNICRSAAAEMILKQMTGSRVMVCSAATTREEIGNGLYPPMARALDKAGYAMGKHTARQTVKADYQAWDYIIAMDHENLYDLHRIYGGDPEGKISLLKAWAGRLDEDIEDPWYTRNFNGVVKEIEEGCRGIVKQLCEEKG